MDLDKECSFNIHTFEIPSLVSIKLYMHGHKEYRISGHLQCPDVF